MDKFSLILAVTLINIGFLASFIVPDIDIVEKNNDQRAGVEALTPDKRTDEGFIPDKGTEEDFLAEKETPERLTSDKGTLEGVMASSMPSIPGLSETEINAFVGKRRLSMLKGAARGTYTLIEPEGAGWGYYRDWQFCPGDSWAIGYAQRVEPPQGRGDDTAMNSIELVCGDVNGNIVGKIRSYDGIWGYWGTPAFCNGLNNFLRGVQLKIEPDQGRGDDTAANDSHFWCAFGNMIQATNGAPWGTWRQSAFCPLNSFICGLQIKFEPDQSRSDDTAMNGSKFLCCSL